MRLEDKVIIVTGAAGGLGRQYAIRFAKEGAKLTVADIQDTAQTAELCRAEGADVLALRVDVSSEDEMQDMAKQTNEKYGRIDGLLNNAGMMRGLEVKSILGRRYGDVGPRVRRQRSRHVPWRQVGLPLHA